MNMISTEFLGLFLSFNSFVFIVNIIIAIFATKIIKILDTADLEKLQNNHKNELNIKKKKNFLHFINFIIFIVYFISFFANMEIINNIIKSLFIILVIFIINSWLIRKIVMYYGEEYESNGEKYLKRGYKTNLFSLIVTIISIISIISFLLSIFGMTSLLQSGGFIAGLLAFLGFTSPVWAPDMISGIIILHNGRIEYGDIIKIKELNIKAWVKSISLTEIKLIDLIYNQPILLRPSVFKNYTIENISLNISGIGKKISIKQILDIKIGYDVDKEDVKKMCYDAFNTMIEDIKKTDNNTHGELLQRKKFFPENCKVLVEIDKFEDFAILYKMTYEITSPFYMIKAERLLNEYLYDKQKQYGISLSTPIIEVSSQSLSNN